MSKGKVFRDWSTNKEILHVMRKENMEEIKGTGGQEFTLEKQYLIQERRETKFINADN